MDVMTPGYADLRSAADVAFSNTEEVVVAAFQVVMHADWAHTLRQCTVVPCVLFIINLSTRRNACSSRCQLTIFFLLAHIINMTMWGSSGCQAQI